MTEMSACEVHYYGWGEKLFCQLENVPKPPTSVQTLSLVHKDISWQDSIIYHSNAPQTIGVNKC
jgi:hypothetical protein